jgi:hypothetical protein
MDGKQSHTLTPWQVDSVPDANGFSTLRRADDSEHGDTDSEPIATVYKEDDAEQIVRCVNSHEALVAALREAHQFIEVLSELYRNGQSYVATIANHTRALLAEVEPDKE